MQCSQPIIWLDNIRSWNCIYLAITSTSSRLMFFLNQSYNATCRSKIIVTQFWLPVLCISCDFQTPPSCLADRIFLLHSSGYTVSVSLIACLINHFPAISDICRMSYALSLACVDVLWKPILQNIMNQIGLLLREQSDQGS